MAVSSDGARSRGLGINANLLLRVSSSFALPKTNKELAPSDAVNRLKQTLLQFFTRLGKGA